MHVLDVSSPPTGVHGPHAATEAEQAIHLGTLSGLSLALWAWLGHTVGVVPRGCGSLRWAESRRGEAMSENPESDRVERRRRANVAGGRQHTHKVRVSPEEEGHLLRLALEQGVTVPRLLVESALAAEAGETVTERRQAIAELFALHRYLASLSNNVNQIAKAANATGETGEDLRATFAAVRHTAVRINDAIEELAS